MLKISHGLNKECASGKHKDCSGRRGFHNCPCSCHHILTVNGQCAMYGCDCHEQNGNHGLPFQRKYRIRCPI